MSSRPVLTATRSTAPALLIAGVAATAFGLALLVWPTKAALALTGIIAVHAVIAGIVHVCTGVFARSVAAHVRLGSIVLGLLYTLAGVFAFASLPQSAGFLELFLTVVVGMLWIIDGLTALFTLRRSTTKGPTITFAVVAVVAGVALLSSPGWGAETLWWLLGLALVVLGALNVLRALAGGGK